MSKIKTAADQLLALASQLEKEAAEKTIFACEGCGHVASLEEINGEITKYASKVASEGGSFDSKKAMVTVNDTVKCSGCEDGKMHYAATDESEKYYASEEDLEELEKREAAEKEAAEKEAAVEKEAGRLLDSLKKGLNKTMDILKAPAGVINSGDKMKAEDIHHFLDSKSITPKSFEDGVRTLEKSGVTPKSFEFIYELKSDPAQLEAAISNFEQKYGKDLADVARILANSGGKTASMSRPAKGVLAALMLLIGTAAASDGTSKIDMNKYLPGFDQASQMIDSLAATDVPTHLDLQTDDQAKADTDKNPNEKTVEDLQNEGWTVHNASINQEKLASYLG